MENSETTSLTTMRINRLFLLLLTLLTATMMLAQDKKLFTLEDLNFGGTNYNKMRPENRFTTWWGDEFIHLDVENVSVVDKARVTETSLFTLSDLNTWAGLEGEDVVRTLLSAKFPYSGESLVLVSNKTKRMLIDFKAKKLVWSQDRKGSLEWNAKSKADAYLDNNNLYVRTADGKTTQLSTDGSREIVYGQSVHRNEFGIEKGTFWSEDGKKLAFYRMDQSMVEDYPQVDLFQREAKHDPDKYPMAGMTSHKVTVGIYDIDTQKTIYLNVGDPTDRYFTNIAWSPDSKNIYLFELNRDQNDCSLDEYSAENGEKIRTLYTEKDEKYVEPQHPISFIPWNKQKFLLWSQKDGYMHLYVGNVNGDISLKQLTKGNFVVDEILGFCAKTKSVIIRSNEADPLQMNLWSVNIETGSSGLSAQTPAPSADP